MKIYIPLGLHVQNQPQKVQLIHASATPTWEMNSFGQRGSAVSFEGRSFELLGPSLGLRGPCVDREVLFDLRGPFIGLKGSSFDLRGPFSVQDVPVLA